MAKITTTVSQHLESLGFIINFKKSDLEPKHIQEFLGFSFNSSKMEIKVPVKKMIKLTLRIKQAYETKSCRWIAALLGKITSMIPAISDALLNIRYIQRDLARNLRLNLHHWDRPCPLSTQAHSELNWWVSIATTKNGLKIRQPVLPPPIDAIFVDASDSGWGIKSSIIRTAGHWTPAESEQSINVRELRTILFALQIHANDYARQHHSIGGHS
jgi:hypothetical protein